MIQKVVCICQGDTLGSVSADRVVLEVGQSAHLGVHHSVVDRLVVGDSVGVHRLLSALLLVIGVLEIDHDVV
jgi:hypothetical protein